MPLTARIRRRLVVGGVALSCVALGLDQGAPQLTAPVRNAAATAFTPVQDRLTLAERRHVRTLRAERDAARRALSGYGDDQALSNRLEALLGAPSTAGRRVIPARVIAFSPATAPGQRVSVTIDVGARDGVRPQQTVVAEPGLVGRTTTVRADTSDVETLTSPATVVGARVQRSAALGSVAATTPTGVPRRGAGELSLSLVALGDVRAGDVVRTLGSIGERPYVRDVVIGTVVGVDPDRGQLGRTARLRPAVTLSALDVVGVVQAAPRAGPGPAATGTGAR